MTDKKTVWKFYLFNPVLFGSPKLMLIAQWDGELTATAMIFFKRHLDAHPEKSPRRVLIVRETLEA